MSSVSGLASMWELSSLWGFVAVI